MSKTLDELNKEYKYDTEFLKQGLSIHPTHKKWLQIAWEIQNVYGFVHAEKISLGKARELVTSIIEKHSQNQNLQQ